MAINGDCFDVATATIEIEPELKLFVPTAFTPDDEDGVNDFWKPVFSDANLLVCPTSWKYSLDGEKSVFVDRPG